jgi:hypothetical protein
VRVPPDQPDAAGAAGTVFCESPWGENSMHQQMPRGVGPQIYCYKFAAKCKPLTEGSDAFFAFFIGETVLATIVLGALCMVTSID